MENRLVYPNFIKKDICDFVVWAPKARQMNLVIQNPHRRIPMEHHGKGYWKVRIEDVQEGTRYKYEINNKKTFPDPASLSQPKGVHGFSEVLKLNNFAWKDKNWKGIDLSDMIMYELHTGTFTSRGTFEGIESKLDYLVDLGINTIEILPVAQFSGHRNWGYDGVYPFAVQNSYGGAKALMNLVNACHNKNIAVILDVVYNHFGPEGNYVGNFGHYFSEKYSTPWGQPINYDDAYSDGVRNYFIENALMWLRDFHIDGLRLDAIHAIYDFGSTHVLEELAQNVNELQLKTKKKYHLIGESNLNDVRYISPPERGGYNLDAQWSDDFHHALHTYLTGEKSGYYMDYGESNHLAKSLENAFVYDGEYSEFRKKFYGNSTHRNPGSQFVIFTQNHDQTGNRKFGDRLITLTDFDTAKLAAGFMFLAPNIPMLFMGEEYAERNPFLYFVNHESEDLNELVRQGRKKEFEDFFSDDDEAPDPVSIDTFKRSLLSWSKDSKDESKRMFRFYKEIIQLRKTHPVLKDPDKLNISVQHFENVFMIHRWKDKIEIFALFNTEDHSKELKVPDDLKGTLYSVFDGGDKKWSAIEKLCPEKIAVGDTLNIPAKSFVIYSNNISL